jgi:hypothetical protein
MVHNNTFTIGDSILSINQDINNDDNWMRGKIVFINEDGTYMITFLGESTKYNQTHENIRLFDTRLIDIPVETPDFTFIKRISDRVALSNGYKTLVNIDGWHIIRRFIGSSLMFTVDSEINRVIRIIYNNHYHNGESIEWTMRQLERISQIGVYTFKKEWLESNKENENNINEV